MRRTKDDISIIRSFRAPFLLIISTLLVGILGFEIIEGWSFLDSLYMTVITLGTVGFSEIKTLSSAGRIFTIFLISFGITVVGYTIGSITRYIVEGEIKNIFIRKKMMKNVKNMEKHFIICGYGRTGKQVADELLKAKKDFVVIDNKEDDLKEIGKFPYLIGDATDDEILIEAGIKKAKGLVASLKDDSDNLFVTLSARGLNKDIFIATRCLEENSEKKLYRAGANKVIMPLIQLGKRFAKLLINPDITSFLDIVSGESEVDLTMDELEIEEGSELEGKNLRNSSIRERTNGMVIAIRKEKYRLIVNPSVNEVINKGDVLIVICELDQLENLKRMAKKV